MSKRKSDNELYDETANILRKMFYGEDKNKNLLTELAKPEMTLYEICGNYFETEAELIDFCNVSKKNIDNACTLNYIRTFANRNDVIAKITKSGRYTFYTAIDENGYAIYNHDISVYRGDFTWQYNYGTLKSLYSQFRDRGIVFENDIYAKSNELYEKILRMCKENNLFNK